jgi:hypothetical protein
MAGFKTQSPNLNAFPDAQQQSAIRSLHDRVTLLEKKTGTQGLDLRNQGVIGQTPPQPTLSVVGNPGMVVVKITNPHFATVTARSPKDRNQVGVVAHHLIEYSPFPDFSSGTQSFPVSPQTYYEVTMKGTNYWRVRSTYDGKYYSQPTHSGQVSS